MVLKPYSFKCIFFEFFISHFRYEYRDVSMESFFLLILSYFSLLVSHIYVLYID